jgi:ATP-dependent DNA helicase PIF1
MKNKEVIEAVDKCLRDITKEDHLFGGIPVMLGENLAQILPVVPKGSCSDIVNACLQQSYV